jgi:putative restriction endonuclease
MASWDAVQPQHVRQAAAEFDQLGQEEFLARYGFGPARRYLLIIGGREYDSKAVLGAAYGHATGRPLRSAEFSGGTLGAARVLRALGFEIRELHSPPP